jgi:hypothetical protein
MYLDAQLFATAASYWPLTRISQRGRREDAVSRCAGTAGDLPPQFHPGTPAYSASAALSSDVREMTRQDFAAVSALR